MYDRLYNSSAQQSRYSFCGKIPFKSDETQKAKEIMTNSYSNDYTSNYRQRQSTVWAPLENSYPDPPLCIQPVAIYHRHVGQMPDFGGHVPGFIFRFGKTFGNDTRDAKRWLRGEFST